MKTTLARHAAALLACAGLSLATPALAQDKTVKIGVLNDMSSLYADIGGPNSVVAVKMAVEDSGLTKKAGRSTSSAAITRTSRTSASTSRGNGSTPTRSMRSLDTPNSGVALAVSNLVKEKNSMLLNSGGASAALTGEACTPNTLSVTYDTYMLALAPARR